MPPLPDMQFETRVREIFTPGRSQRRGSALARQSKRTAIGARTSSDMLSLPRRAIHVNFMAASAHLSRRSGSQAMSVGERAFGEPATGTGFEQSFKIGST
jgi:hypothetical protein